MNNRIQSMRQAVLTTRPRICADRARIVTQTYREHEYLEGESLRAKALYNILAGMEIRIFDGEVLVGCQASTRRAAPIFPEFSTDWLPWELEHMGERTSDPFDLDRETRSELMALLSYWNGRTTKAAALPGIDQEARLANEEHVYILSALSSGLGHIAVSYEKLLRQGTSGIIREIDGYIAQAGSDKEKIAFYQAASLVLKGLNVFARRFARLAEEMAQSCSDPERREELLEIARVCNRVPEQPATSFREALQSFWFLHLAMQLESNGHSMSPGRFDQYLYPYYRADLESGALNREEALFLLEGLFLKFNEVNKLRDRAGTLAFGGYPMFQNLILGGVDAGGDDVTNDLSYLCIQAALELAMPQPSLSVRCHQGMPEDFLVKSCQLAKIGIGMPAFFNDQVIIPVLEAAGCTLEESRCYAEVGCVEPQVPGKTEGLYSGGFLNICKVLELALNDGVNPVTGTRYSLSTGLHFESFQEFYAAFRKQLAHFVHLQAMADNVLDEIHSKLAPTPLVSCFVEDCLAKGRDVRKGGARYNFTSPNIVGLANAADALAVIKTKVFEQRALSLRQMREVLKHNFQGEEEIRQIFLNDVPKYGNDDRSVDAIARRIAADYCDEVKRHKNFRGGSFEPGLQSVSTHALFVGTVGATPDGRTRESLVSDGGVSPAQGRDKNGPTAVISSVARLDHSKATNGALLNIKFHPSAVQGEKGTNTLMALVRSFFAMGGQHIQFNIVGGDVLRDAQIHPENYSDLVVRVAGFSVLYTTLDKVLQNDIIERTEHE